MPESDPLTIQRGDYGRNLLPIALFTLGRALTGPAQYALITAHPLSGFGIPPPPTGSPAITLLNHTLPRLPFLTALMPTVLSAKHVFWLLVLCRERMTVNFAFFAVLADFIYEAVTSLIFTTANVNPMFSLRFFHAGMTIYFASVALELLAELQRAAFKRRPENRGKVCKTGFWGITRHVNYTANLLYGFGYGLAAGGPVYAMATGGMYACNFVFNAMPGLEAYGREKYGKDWTRYEREVPWQLVPWIY